MTRRILLAMLAFLVVFYITTLIQAANLPPLPGYYP